MDWHDTLQISLNNINLSFNNFYDTFSSLLDKHAPIKRMKNRNLKSKIKPWINHEVKAPGGGRGQNRRSFSNFDT